MRRSPDTNVLEQFQNGGHQLHTASVVIHELHYGLSRQAGRKKERLTSFLEALLTSNMPILPYDLSAALWHGTQRAQCESLGRITPFVDGQIAAIASTNSLVLITRNTKDFAPFENLQVANWFGTP